MSLEALRDRIGDALARSSESIDAALNLGAPEVAVVLAQKREAAERDLARVGAALEGTAPLDEAERERLARLYR